MLSFGSRLLKFLFVLLILVACAHAQPDSSNSYDAMDLDLFGVGQFVEAVANEEMAQMSTSPSWPDIYHFDAVTRPNNDQAPNYTLPRVYNNTMSPSYPQHYGYGTLGTQQPSYAAVARQGIGVGLHGEGHQMGSTFTQYQSQQQIHAHPTIQAGNVGVQNRVSQSAPYTGQPTYAQAARMPSPPSQSFSQERYSQPLQSGNAGQDLTPLPVHRDNYNTRDRNKAWTPQASIPPGVQIVSRNVTANFNYTPGMVESMGSVDQWLGQSRSIEERLRPQINTSAHSSRRHLADASRSPASVTSLSSSRPSNRRNEQQMKCGKFGCHLCPYRFESNAALNQHMRKHRAYEERPYQCYKGCEKRFTYAKDLRRHLDTHNPNPPRFRCPFGHCKFSNPGFKREDHLNRHIRTLHAADSAMQTSSSQSDML